MRRRALIAVVAVVSAAASSTGASTLDGFALSNAIVDVAAGAGAGTAGVVAFVGRSSVSTPRNVDVAPRFVVGDTATIDLASVEGVDAAVPYQFRFRATSLAAGEHQTRIDVRAGSSNVGWLSGVLAAGSSIRDGEYVESMVASVPPIPTTPARSTTPGGSLAWEPIGPVAHTITFRDWDPRLVDFVSGGMRTVSAAAILRVDGGDLHATTDQTTEALVPLPGYKSGIVFTARQSRLPDIVYSSTLALVDDGAGGKALRIRVTVPAGTRWPQSGDELPGGTWKLRIDVNAADLTGLPPQARALVELGLPGPGMAASYLYGGREFTVPEAVRTRFLVGRSGPELLDALTAPAGTASGTTDVRPETRALQACDGVVSSSTGVAQYQPSGALELCRGGSVADVVMNGTAIGTLGLPYAEVGGVPRAVEWFGGATPKVYEHSFWIAPDNYGSQFNVVLHGRAGTLEFDALLSITLNDDGGNVIPLILDYRNNAAAGARLGWLIDADAADERFSVHGAAPAASEIALASDGLSGLLAVQPPHVIAGSGSVRHTFTPWAALDLVIHRREPALPVGGGHAEAAIAPPEPLDGSDVAMLAVIPLPADHSQWHGNRAPVVSNAYNTIPAQARGPVNTALAFGLLATGQTGLTFYHVITGV